MALSKLAASRSLNSTELDSSTLRTSNESDVELLNDNILGQEINFLANTLDLNVTNTLQYPSSEYLTINQFKSLDKIDKFSIMHLNTRSLKHNFDNLRLLLDNPRNSSFSVIGLTETWLTKSSAVYYSLPGYKFIENSRINKTGGGVAFYIKDDLDFHVLSEVSLMNDIVESLSIEIKVPDSKNILITVIYKPPNSSCKLFLEYLQELLHNPLFNNKDCFIIGDFNIDLSQCHSHNTSQEFLDTMLSATFLPLITKPTRVTNHSATLIDNIFCNINPLPESGIVLSDLSDHYPLFTLFSRRSLITKNNTKERFRKITPQNLQNLKNDLGTADWSEVYNNEDTNLSYEKFIQISTSYLDKHIPFVKKKSNYKKVPRLPWVSKSLLRSINRKNKLYYIDKTNHTEESHRTYTLYKNTLTKTLRAEKRKYFQDQISHFKNDIKNTWKIINFAINKNNDKVQINKIKHNDTEIHDFDTIASTFNNYFSQIGKNLAESIPPTNKKFSDFLRAPNPNSLFFLPVIKEELKDAVGKLKDKKALVTMA